MYFKEQTFACAMEDAGMQLYYGNLGKEGKQR
jgi:hypothetical protein